MDFNIQYRIVVHILCSKRLVWAKTIEEFKIGIAYPEQLKL